LILPAALLCNYGHGSCLIDIGTEGGVATIPLFAQSSAGAESPEGLIKQVFAALERKDSTALQELSISQDDFKKFVWPTFTTPPTGTNAEKFYKMLGGVLERDGHYKVATYYVRSSH
jgi:hypothetical protein